jgi:hypothetical protein
MQSTRNTEVPDMTPGPAYERRKRNDGRATLATFDRPSLRRALWLLRRETARPHEPNPAAAQYDAAGITLAMTGAEYRRRGWKTPRATRSERP